MLGTGREYLSPEILRIVDNTLPYEQMQIGETLIVWAEDALTRQLTSFTILVVSIRENERGRKSATFEYVGDDFNFFDGENPQKTVKITAGTLMENGVSTTLIPQADYHLSYFGGIGRGRDHSFEFVGGEDHSVIVHKVSRIDVVAAQNNYQAPNYLSLHLEKMEETKQRQMQDEGKRIAELERTVMADLEKWFGDYPAYQEIRELISGYSPNGKLMMSSFLIYGKEDGVLDRAWETLKLAHHDHFEYEHPMVRDDLDLKASSRMRYERMIREAGIKWPRPIRLPENEERVAQLTRKANEYKERLKELDHSERTKLHAQHSLAILEEVLSLKFADINTLREKLRNEVWFDEGLFERAVELIRDYCATGGKNVSGGTGLK